jgi:RNA polymerase sigma-70 factor, ECF subfamily
MTDADRFEAFVRRYQDMVFATAVRLLGSRVEAEDIAQTVFLRAFQRFEEIGVSPTAAGWLKAVTRNVCLNHLSRYRARWQLAGEEEAALVPAAADSPALQLEDADRRERLARVLNCLPDHQRVPLVLFHFEEMSYQDIALVLGISVGKVKTDIHRGRQALRAQLSDDAAR